MTGSSDGAPRRVAKADAAWCGATGKQRHLTLLDANAALARSRTTGTTGEMHAYHCDACRGFHVGHSGRHGRHWNGDRRRRGPRLSGTAWLRRKLGQALAAGPAYARRVKAIVALMRRSDARRG